MLKEKIITGASGWLMVAVLAAGAVIGVWLLSTEPEPAMIAVIIPLLVLDLVCWGGLTVVNPNTARVVLLFGRYHGTIKTPGLRWVNPLTMRRFVSLKVRNF